MASLKMVSDGLYIAGIVFFLLGFIAGQITESIGLSMAIDTIGAILMIIATCMPK